MGVYTGPILCFFEGFFLFIVRQKVYPKLRWLGTEVGEHKMINMTIRELYCTFADFYKIGIYEGFPLHNTVLISPKETAKLRWARWGAEGGCRVAH